MRAMLLHVIYCVTSTSLVLPFAYSAYRSATVRGGQPAGTLRTGGREALAEAVWFAAQFTLAVVVADTVWRRVIGVPASGWFVVGSLGVYIVVVAVVMAAIDRAIRAWIRGGRRNVTCFLAAAFVGVLSQLLIAQFVVTAYYLEDEGLTSRRVQRGARIGSPGGPHVGLAAHLGYYVLRPVRGAVVTIRSEQLSGVPITWQRGVPERFHYAGMAPLGIGFYLGRVVGMPGEAVTLDLGAVIINGQPLAEPYVDNQMSEHDSVAVQLGERDYLLAEDVRRDHHASANPFYLAHESQILSRQLFVVWPIDSFGFVQPPLYTRRYRK